MAGYIAGLKRPWRQDLTGKKFGRLTVISKAPDRGTHKVWLCRCECGKEGEHYGGHLKAGNSISCGCWCSEKTREANQTHGQTGHRLYNTWQNMLNRCRSPKNQDYHSYGGRGIIVCNEWKDFAVFLSDMGPSFIEGKSLDRIDFNGNYCKANCRWADAVQQANNSRRNVMIEFEGKCMSVTQWERHLGKRPGTIKARLVAGKSVNEALFAGSYTSKGIPLSQ